MAEAQTRTETERSGQWEATQGDGNQPADLGYAPPDPGLGDGAESEIPVGVDALDPEKVEAAKEAASENEGDGFDISAIVAGANDGAAADEAGEDAPQKTDPTAQVAPDTGDAS